MDYENVFKTIISSTDFNRGFIVGVIDTVKTLYSLEVDDIIAKGILDRDFEFDDINLLRDAVMEDIKNKKNNNPKESTNNKNGADV